MVDEDTMKKAQSLVEYTLILILISLIAISTLHFLGRKMTFDKNNVPNTQENITETMTSYCEQKGMIYNSDTESCEGIPEQSEENDEK